MFFYINAGGLTEVDANSTHFNEMFFKVVTKTSHRSIFKEKYWSYLWINKQYFYQVENIRFPRDPMPK